MMFLDISRNSFLSSTDNIMAFVFVFRTLFFWECYGDDISVKMILMAKSSQMMHHACRITHIIFHAISSTTLLFEVSLLTVFVLVFSMPLLTLSLSHLQFVYDVL